MVTGTAVPFVAASTIAGGGVGVPFFSWLGMAAAVVVLGRILSRRLERGTLKESRAIVVVAEAAVAAVVAWGCGSTGAGA